MGLVAGENPHKFIDWFESMTPTWGPPTLRGYLAALLFVLEPTGPGSIYKRVKNIAVDDAVNSRHAARFMCRGCRSG